MVPTRAELSQVPSRLETSHWAIPNNKERGTEEVGLDGGLSKKCGLESLDVRVG